MNPLYAGVSVGGSAYRVNGPPDGYVMSPTRSIETVRRDQIGSWEVVPEKIASLGGSVYVVCCPSAI
jgi:hypothetical protein